MCIFVQQQKDLGAGDTAQWLMTLAALAEDLGSIPGTDISDNYL